MYADSLLFFSLFFVFVSELLSFCFCRANSWRKRRNFSKTYKIEFTSRVLIFHGWWRQRWKGDKGLPYHCWWTLCFWGLCFWWDNGGGYNPNKSYGQWYSPSQGKNKSNFPRDDYRCCRFFNRMRVFTPVETRVPALSIEALAMMFPQPQPPILSVIEAAVGPSTRASMEEFKDVFNYLTLGRTPFNFPILTDEER